MRTTILILLSSCLCAADAAPTVTADDLQNLAACARLQLKDLTPAQMVTVAQAIQHAEDEIKRLRALPPLATTPVKK